MSTAKSLQLIARPTVWTYQEQTTSPGYCLNEPAPDARNVAMRVLRHQSRQLQCAEYPLCGAYAEFQWLGSSGRFRRTYRCPHLRRVRNLIHRPGLAARRSESPTQRFHFSGRKAVDVNRRPLPLCPACRAPVQMAEQTPRGVGVRNRRAHDAPLSIDQLRSSHRAVARSVDWHQRLPVQKG